MQLWLGLGLSGPPMAALAWWAARKKQHPTGIAVLTVMSGTNLILLDQGVPVGQRLLPTLAAAAAAGMIAAGWELGSKQPS